MKRSTLYTAALAVVLALGLSTIPSAQTNPTTAAPNRVTVDKATVDEVCWNITPGPKDTKPAQQCEPLARIIAEFEGHVANQQTPYHAALQNFINSQAQLARVSRLAQILEAQITPITDDMDKLRQQQTILDTARERAAGSKERWDTQLGIYVPKTSTPPPAGTTGGRGGGHLNQN